MTSLSAWRCLIVGLTVLMVSDAVNEVDLGHLKLGVCREERIDFVWTLPASQNVSEIYNIDFRYQALHVLLSKSQGGNWKTTTAIKRYIGRIFPYSDTYSTNFYLDNVLIKDRGNYDLFVNAKGVNYHGTAPLRVFAEDNLWPDAVGNTSDVAETTPDGATQYRYTFRMPGHDSPIVAVEMVAKDKEGHLSERKSCSLGDNITICDIVFTMEDFKQMSGTLVLDVIPLYEEGTPDCQKLNQFNNLMITIVHPTGLTPATIGGLVVAAVAVVVLGCVLPPVVTKYMKDRYKTIPLNKGLAFVEYCTSTIQKYESHEDLKGIYRENKPESQVTRFIEDYNKKGDLGEDYKNERGLMAAGIKLYLKKETTPWLPLTMQSNITEGEKNYMLSETEFDVETVRRLLNDVTTNNKDSVARRDIIRHLLYHFKWLATERETFPPNCNVVNLKGLVICLAPNFFKEANEEMWKAKSDENAIARTQRANELSERQRAFMRQLVSHVSQVFPDISSDTVNEADMTARGLLSKDEENNIV